MKSAPEHSSLDQQKQPACFVVLLQVNCRRILNVSNFFMAHHARRPNCGYYLGHQTGVNSPAGTSDLGLKNIETNFQGKLLLVTRSTLMSEGIFGGT
jgi:hypothetical protein